MRKTVTNLVAIFIVFCFATVGVISLIGSNHDYIAFQKLNPQISNISTAKNANHTYQNHNNKALMISPQYHCPYTKNDAKCENWYAEQNIMVQNESLKWNKFLFVVTCIGIFFVGVTLWQTQKAVNAANETNKIARHASEIELRAYLDIPSFHFKESLYEQLIFHESSAYKDLKERISFSIRNNGKTPAYNIDYKITLQIRSANGVAQSFEGKGEINYIPQSKDHILCKRRLFYKNNIDDFLKIINDDVFEVHIIVCMRYFDEFSIQDRKEKRPFKATFWGNLSNKEFTSITSINAKDDQPHSKNQS